MRKRAFVFQLDIVNYCLAFFLSATVHIIYKKAYERKMASFLYKHMFKKICVALTRSILSNFVIPMAFDSINNKCVSLTTTKRKRINEISYR